MTVNHVSTRLNQRRCCALCNLFDMQQSRGAGQWLAGTRRWRVAAGSDTRVAWVWQDLPARRPSNATLLVRRRSREVFALEQAGVLAKHWFRVNPRDWFATLGKSSHGLHEYRATQEAHRRGRVPRGPVAFAERRGVGGYRGGCLVLPLVGGASLGERLRDSGASDTAIWQLCAAYAGMLGGHHRAGLLHNDYKPANVMLDDAGTLVTIDWGESLPMDAMAPAAREAAMQVEFATGFRRLLYPMYARFPVNGLFDAFVAPYLAAAGRAGRGDLSVLAAAVNSGLAAQESRHRARRKRESSRAQVGEAAGWRYALMQPARRAPLEALLRGEEGSGLAFTEVRADEVWKAVTALPTGDPGVAAVVARAREARGSGQHVLVVDAASPFDPQQAIDRYEQLLTFRV